MGVAGLTTVTSGTAKTAAFLDALDKSLSDGSFVKISLGNYKGAEEALKNIYIKKILIKEEEKLSFTYHYKTRDIVKNYSFDEGAGRAGEYLEGGFHVATLFTTVADFLYENINNKKHTLREMPPSQTGAVSLEHNRSKNRIIPAAGKSYLCELKITDAAGNVFKNAQDKYRQINRYVEILSTLIKGIPPERLKRVVDMGSGKGYLTFALYDYLANVLHLDTRVTGVEMREDLVKLCNGIAANAGFKNLDFVEGRISVHDSAGTNILIALHACDTATDEAIHKGITAGAELIVVAPCCHKQIRQEIEKNKAHNALDFLTRHGIFLERQAEMVTDGLRALILEYFGYTTKVFEFISDAHTPKNVLIVGVRNSKAAGTDKAILEKIKQTKAFFGIGTHHLERLTGL